jgi:glycosyltransferase involved in cell wall biosynthesis
MNAVHQIMPALVYGDAIGNHAMEIWSTLRKRGIPSTIYAKYIDPRYAHAARDYRDYEDRAGHTLIYHFSIGSEVTDFVLSLKRSRAGVYYHNITPAHFFNGINPVLARELADGREQLQRLKGVPFAIAASEYNRLELLDAGYPEPDVVHYLVDFERLDRGGRTAQAGRIREASRREGLKLLFVGRVAPNKCQHDLVWLARYLREVIDPQVQLWIVGNFANAGSYHARLQAMVMQFGLTNNVRMTGPAGTDDGLAAYYQSADAFVCMSEHEGFCVPVIEAMHYRLPVFAFNATGVPYTMGDAGVLFNHKQHDAVAESILYFQRDSVARNTLLDGQTRRLQAFDLRAERDHLTAVLEKVSR